MDTMDTEMMDVDVPEKMIEVRKIVNNNIATQTYLIPISEAKTRDELVNAVAKFPAAMMPPKLFDTRKPGEVPDHGIFLLQETRTSTHKQCHRRWWTMDYYNAQEYLNWYRDVVESGSEDTYCVEIHLFYHQEQDLTPEMQANNLQAWSELEREMQEAAPGYKEFPEHRLTYYIPFEDDPYNIDVVTRGMLTREFIPMRKLDQDQLHGGCSACREVIKQQRAEQAEKGQGWSGSFVMR